MLREMIESQHIDSSPLRQMSVVLGSLEVEAGREGARKRCGAHEVWATVLTGG
ncbi:unnamed protein product [Sphenostylis stenocarpa]|uniref:Uncharacterized protein n=1 Tax=Sphenostylis stenocarpa TaxID=92480 RepID=A0AA86SWK9_9FABA|nr:unnamed protein product [Sphenostylis stenocarpa]